MLQIFGNLRPALSEVFSQKPQLKACNGRGRFGRPANREKKRGNARAICRVVMVGDTCVSEEGMANIVGRDKRYYVCGGAHGFYDAGELIRKHHPDVLLIEPFLMGDDVLVFISRRAILTDGSRAHLDCRSDAHRALLHDSRGNTASRHERNRRHDCRLADPPRTNQER
jgi:hypothetical protein